MLITLPSSLLGTYECQCHDGFKAADKDNCEDIDECLVENGGCDHKCDNVVGSFQCSCHSGYHPLTEIDPKKCVDIDECDETVQPPKCSDTTKTKCVNLPGGFKCDCLPGYEMNEEQCIDVDECIQNNGGCQHFCHNNRLQGYPDWQTL